MFQNAIVRTPSLSLVNGLTTANLGTPNYELALTQHQNYVDALSQCGLEVEEAYTANCIMINGTVLLPQGYPMTRKAIASHGLPIIELDVSELRKIEGGLSSLSLRF